MYQNRSTRRCTRTRDLLSALPDSVLEHILSLLPIQTAVCTSVLSRRYRHSWTQLNNLDLTHVPRSPLLLPPSFFQMQIVTLTLPLFHVINQNTPFVINFPNLKCLSLKFDVRHFEFISRLVTSCPLLQDLSLEPTLDFSDCNLVWDYESSARYLSLETNEEIANDRTLVISSATLINFHFISCDELRMRIVVDAPLLNKFKFRGESICSFVSQPLMLREAVVESGYEPNIISVLPQILSVSKLDLLTRALGVVEQCKTDDGSPLVFSNLTELTLIGDRPHGELNCRSLLPHVKTINLQVYLVREGDDLKSGRDYLLSNAPALELLRFIVLPSSDAVIVSNPFWNVDEQTLRKKLEEMLFCIYLYEYVERYTPRCRIEFRGVLVNLPTNVQELEEMKENVQPLQARISPNHDIFPL